MDGLVNINYVIHGNMLLIDYSLLKNWNFFQKKAGICSGGMESEEWTLWVSKHLVQDKQFENVR